MRIIMLLIIVATLLMVFAGCTTSAPATSSSPATTSSPTPTNIPTASAASQTYGDLATTGKTVYTSKCAGCHGDAGQGGKAPAVIGSNAKLSKYNTAQGLLDYISVSMPFNAPGSLSHQDYLNVLSYLLVQNNSVPAASPFDPNRLSNVQLK